MARLRAYWCGNQGEVQSDELLCAILNHQCTSWNLQSSQVLSLLFYIFTTCLATHRARCTWTCWKTLQASAATVAVIIVINPHLTVAAVRWNLLQGKKVPMELCALCVHLRAWLALWLPTAVRSVNVWYSIYFRNAKMLLSETTRVLKGIVLYAFSGVCGQSQSILCVSYLLIAELLHSLLVLM